MPSFPRTQSTHYYYLHDISVHTRLVKKTSRTINSVEDRGLISIAKNTSNEHRNVCPPYKCI